MKLREYFLYAKKTKNDYSTIWIIQRLLCVSVAPFLRISTGRKLCTLFRVSHTSRIRLLRLFTLWFELKQRILVARLTQNSVHSLRPADILQNGATLTNCWIKSLFFFFAYKKYSRIFIMLRLNHWWQMDYSDDFFLYFSGPWQC